MSSEEHSSPMKDPVAPAPHAKSMQWKDTLVEFFLRGRALADARHGELSVARKAHVAAARRALAAAQALIEQDLAEMGHAAISLCREALYWTGRAQCQDDVSPAVALRQWFSTMSPEDCTKLAGGEENLALVRDALIDRTFVEAAELADPGLQAAAMASHRFVERLIAREDAPDAAVRRVRTQRWLRPLVASLAILLVVWSVPKIVRAVHPPADFAAGRTWRASSGHGTAMPAAGTVGVQPAWGLMFHTDQQSEPWLEIDLGEPRRIHEVEVINASDLSERAVPLVVEVGDNPQSFTEVARRTSDFSTWEATFSARNARYVRLRVLKTTYFHLTNVKVH
jgi:hypothetical protein